MGYWEEGCLGEGMVGGLMGGIVMGCVFQMSLVKYQVQRLMYNNNLIFSSMGWVLPTLIVFVFVASPENLVYSQQVQSFSSIINKQQICRPLLGMINANMITGIQSPILTRVIQSQSKYEIASETKSSTKFESKSQTKFESKTQKKFESKSQKKSQTKFEWKSSKKQQNQKTTRQVKTQQTKQTTTTKLISTNSPAADEFDDFDPDYFLKVSKYLYDNRKNYINFSKLAQRNQNINCCVGTPNLQIIPADYQDLESANYQIFTPDDAPYPGYRKLVDADNNPYVRYFQNCSNDGKGPSPTMLWVNGINNNWNGIYRVFFRYTVYVTSGVYRICFQAKNLPKIKNWDAKPFGFITISQFNRESQSFFYVNISDGTSDCIWKTVTSRKMKLVNGTVVILFSLYNGQQADGNDLILGNISLIKLGKPKMMQFNFSFVTLRDRQIGVRLRPINPPTNCLDRVSVSTKPNPQPKTLSQNIPSTTTHIIPLAYKTVNLVSVTRQCPCFVDSYWTALVEIFGRPSESRFNPDSYAELISFTSFSL